MGIIQRVYTLIHPRKRSFSNTWQIHLDAWGCMSSGPLLPMVLVTRRGSIYIIDLLNMKFHPEVRRRRHRLKHLRLMMGLSTFSIEACFHLSTRCIFLQNIVTCNGQFICVSTMTCIFNNKDSSKKGSHHTSM